MDNLIIEETKYTPLVRFDSDSHVLEIRGESYPENLFTGQKKFRFSDSLQYPDGQMILSEMPIFSNISTLSFFVLYTA